MTPNWKLFMRLERDDHRWSMFLDGDEVCVAQVTSQAAVDAVRRLFGPVALQAYPTNREARR